MFRENNGKVSYTRVSGFIGFVSYLIWGFYLTFVNKSIPDLPPGLLVLLLGLYGINKMSDVFMQKVKGSNG
uniref:Uncharacterized protein n=1 Tax=candidate division WOR-3 bacterium TaxID=2052148 RepID=A0A7V3ZTJ2_UNCW3